MKLRKYRRLPKHIPALAALLLCLSSGACLIQPATPPARVATPGGPMRLIVQDPILVEVVCPAFQTDPAVTCGGPARWSAADLSRGPTAFLQGRLVESSRDLWRNAGISVASFTTALIVSTSGTMEYTVLVRPDPDSDRTEKRSWRSRGRIGMWSVIPFYTGLAGTLIGTALNEYRLPDRLRAACLARRTGEPARAEAAAAGTQNDDLEVRTETATKTDPTAKAGAEDFDPCSEYHDFLQDSYAPVHLPLRKTLGRYEFARPEPAL